MLRFSLFLLLASFSSLSAQTQYQWAVTMGSNQRDEVTDLALDATGNVYVTGVFSDSMDVVKGPEVGYAYGNGGYRDIFLAKYSPTGETLWAFGMGDVRWDRGWALTTDATGAVYTGGVFGGRVDFDPSADSSILESNPAGVWPDGYLAKYDTDGKLRWAKHLLTARNRSASQSATLFALHSMTVDLNGDLLIGGAFWDSVYLDPNTLLVSDGSLRDMFLAKYDTAGNLIWGQRMGGPADQEIRSLATGPQGEIYITGYFFGTADFDPSANVSQLSSIGSGDIFLAKYDANGALQWAHGFGSPDAVTIAPESGNGVGVDANGNVYLTGVFYGSMDVDGGSDSTILTPVSTVSFFAAQYDSQGQLNWAFRPDKANYNTGKSLVVLPNGDFFVGGEFSTGGFNGLDLDPTADSAMIFATNPGYDPFVAKYDANGAYRDGFGIRGLQPDELFALAANENHLVAGGMFNHSLLVGPPSAPELLFEKGNGDMFLVKYGQAMNALTRPQLELGLQVYPNPATDQLFLQSTTVISGLMELKLLNLQGQTVLQQSFYLRSQLNQTLPVADLPRGIYFLEIQTKAGFLSQKIVLRS